MRPTFPATLVLCVLLAACGGDVAQPDAAGPSDTAPPSEEASSAAGDPPQRIVSLSPTHTETLFAIGAGDRVVAVDDQSDHPEDAPTTDLSGFTPNVEAIAGYDPDLVVLSDDLDGVAEGLAAVEVDTLLLPAPASLDEAYGQMTELGAAVGESDAAGELVEQMQTEIDALVAAVPERDEPLTYFHELDETLYTATSETFIGQVYALAGLEGVVDEADPDGEAGGYPQVTSEFLVGADPDLYFLADVECCAQSADTVAERPGFADIAAVQEDAVVELDGDVASRWGPRVVDMVETIVEATAEVSAG